MTDTPQGSESRSGQGIVTMLELAFSPVEPPARLGDNLEERLAEIRAAAFEELSDWELAAMRDPRNWARPVVAIAVGTAAGAALVLVQMRRGRRQRSGLRGLADQGWRELGDAVAGARARLH
jgi:hypothetical protein